MFPFRAPDIRPRNVKVKNPRWESDMAKKKPAAKSKKLRSGKALEKQKPLLKYNLDNVLISGHQTSGGEGGGGGANN